MSIKQDLDVVDGKRWWKYMWTIQNTLDGIEGNFFKGYDRLYQPITDFEYFSGHLKRNQDYSKPRLFLFRQKEEIMLIVKV